jgi:hypothetical protein
MVHASEVLDEVQFAQRAAKRFAENDQLQSFGNIEPGAFFALRYGLGEDCVVVFRIDSDHTPVNYQQLVREFRVVTP